MFELHVVVDAVVIFNILKLIIQIMPNYPTGVKECLSLLDITSTYLKIADRVEDRFERKTG
jgi:hypothetical protein